jgi:hypothetical protein
MLYDPHKEQQSQLLTDLIATKALISDPEKWLRQAFSHGDDSFCIVGAVGKALITYFMRYPEYEAPEDELDFDDDVLDYYGWYYRDDFYNYHERTTNLIEALYKQLPEEAKNCHSDLCNKSFKLQEYNDAEDTSHSDVIHLFDRAIHTESVKLRNEAMICS